MPRRTPLHTWARLVLSAADLPPQTASEEVAILSEKKNDAPELYVPRIAGQRLHIFNSNDKHKKPEGATSVFSGLPTWRRKSCHVLRDGRR